MHELPDFPATSYKTAEFGGKVASESFGRRCCVARHLVVTDILNRPDARITSGARVRNSAHIHDDLLQDTTIRPYTPTAWPVCCGASTMPTGRWVCQVTY